MATAPLDEWTEEKCLQLIKEYRSRPILWDQRDPLFFKKNLKPAAWQEIGAAVNICADQCKHKMIILMSSFRREKAKIIHSLRRSPGDTSSDPLYPYHSTWFAFKEMSFLLDKDSERKRQLNDSDEIDEEERAINKKLALLSQIDTPTQTVKRPKSFRGSGKEKSRKAARRERKESYVLQVPQPGPSQTPLERDEEIKSFTSFIGNKMKKYTDTTKNAVQQAICEIIFKADQNYYENNCYDKFTIIDEETDPLHKQMYEDEETLIKIQNTSDSD